MRTVLIENGFGPLSRENILRVFHTDPPYLVYIFKHKHWAYLHTYGTYWPHGA